MQIAFLNAVYKPEETSGGACHIRAFVRQCVAMGHAVWSDGGIRIKDCNVFSNSRIPRIRQYRDIDCFYYRMDGSVPGRLRTFRGRKKNWYSRGLNVIEWNTIPEHHFIKYSLTKKQIEEQERLWMTVAKDCDLSICVSDEIESRAKSLGFRETVVVPNGSDPVLFSPDKKVCERMKCYAGNFNIMWIGSASLAWHDLDVISQAAKVIYKSPDFRDKIAFHLIGKGIKNPHQMPANVHYHGEVSYDKLPNWLVGADVGLIAYENGPAMAGSPMKLFDYMAAGLAVVSTKQPQVFSILNELGQSSNVVDVGDSQALAALIIRCYQNKFKTKQDGLYLREALIARYSWEHGVRRILSEIGRRRTENT